MVPVGKFISYCICYFPSVVFIFETFIIYPISPLFLLEKRKQQANLGMPGRKGVQLAVLAFQPGQEVVKEGSSAGSLSLPAWAGSGEGREFSWQS